MKSSTLDMHVTLKDILMAQLLWSLLRKFWKVPPPWRLISVYWETWASCIRTILVKMEREKNPRNTFCRQSVTMCVHLEFRGSIFGPESYEVIWKQDEKHTWFAGFLMTCYLWKISYDWHISYDFIFIYLLLILKQEESFRKQFQNET